MVVRPDGAATTHTHPPPTNTVCSTLLSYYPLHGLNITTYYRLYPRIHSYLTFLFMKIPVDFNTCTAHNGSTRGLVGNAQWS